MNIEWAQVFPAAAIGAGISWLLQYVFVRWCEKRHLDEDLDRGAKAVSLAERLYALHEKACDRHVNLVIPLGRKVVELLPVTDDDLAERRVEVLSTMEVGQYWLISLMWHCVDLTRVKGGHLTIDHAIKHAENCFVSAYAEMDAHALMHDFGDITLTQIIHAFYAYITNKTDANIDAVVQAMDNWSEAHADDDDDESQSRR